MGRGPGRNIPKYIGSTYVGSYDRGQNEGLMPYNNQSGNGPKAAGRTEMQQGKNILSHDFLPVDRSSERLRKRCMTQKLDILFAVSPAARLW